MRPSHYRTRPKVDLTPRQRQVAELLARGKTNPEIADALGITLDGAKFHVSEILDRLGVSTREEAAEWWRERQSLRSRVTRAFAAPFVRWTAIGSAAGAGVAAVVLVLVLARPGQPSGEPAPSPTVSTSPTANPGPDGHFAVLWEQQAAQTQGDTVVYDLDAVREVSRFEGTPVSVGHDGIVLIAQDGVHWMRYDGSGERMIYRADTDFGVGNAVISPDGATVAFAIGQLPTQGGRVLFVDFESGSVVREVTLGPPDWPDLAGSPEVLTWRADGTGVVVTGLTSSERPGGIATVYRDGTVTVSPVQAFGRVSPDGELFAYNDQPALGNSCMFIASTTITITDLATGSTVATVTDPSHGLTRGQWSPDGSAFLYQSRPYIESLDCAWTGADPQTFLLPVDGSAPTQVSDVDALFEQWYGAEYVTYRCGDVEEPAWPVTDGGWTGSCPDGAAPTIVIGGSNVGTAASFRVVGFETVTG